jgi:hypothetical protein
MAICRFSCITPASNMIINPKDALARNVGELSMFPWAPFCSTKAAVKLHTLLDLRGSIPTFIHISDGKMHDVNVLDLLLIEAGAFYIMDRGLPGLRAALRARSSGRLLHHARQAKSRCTARAAGNDARAAASAPANSRVMPSPPGTGRRCPSRGRSCHGSGRKHWFSDGREVHILSQLALL